MNPLFQAFARVGCALTSHQYRIVSVYYGHVTYRETYICKKCYKYLTEERRYDAR